MLMGVTLGACSGGDFGRTRADFRNDDMHGWMGGEVTGSIDALGNLIISVGGKR